MSSEGKRRRQMALHNAEMAGKECAKSGGAKKDNPYVAKKMRGAMVGLYRAWEAGFDEQKKETP